LILTGDDYNAISAAAIPEPGIEMSTPAMHPPRRFAESRSILIEPRHSELLTLQSENEQLRELVMQLYKIIVKNVMDRQ
jgi:hypothetical protein